MRYIEAVIEVKCKIEGPRPRWRMMSYVRKNIVKRSSTLDEKNTRHVLVDIRP